MKALIVGGPLDGQLLDVEGRPSHLNGQAVPRLRLAEISTSVSCPLTHQRYLRTVVAVFGVTFPVYVLQGWPEERMEATLAAMLLTPLAHELVEEYV